MTVDSELAKTLNLPRTSPAFALKQIGNDGSLEVIQLRKIPADSAIYWVSGTSKLASGRDVPSVFVIADGGGSLIKVYWYVGDRWFHSDDADALDALGLSRDEVFPFDWSYALPVANDVYHQ
jgi:hypothetical protein